MRIEPKTAVYNALMNGVRGEYKFEDAFGLLSETVDKELMLMSSHTCSCGSRIFFQDLN